MKLCVLIPGAEYRHNAGARIRYLRLAEPLRKLGVTLELVPVKDALRTGLLDGDVYLASKCFDTTALMVMAMAHRQGKLVGVDLFDDYFSHADDPRFVRMRAWLQQAACFSSFMLASTPAMARISHSFAPDLPVHVLNDPFTRFDLEQIRSRLDSKRQALRDGSPFRISWFGMGDNPLFPVGLSDLVAFCDELAPLRTDRTGVHLHISTNLRAMKGETLAALRQLPLPYRLSEWSETAEAELLERSDAVFIPVNAQPFSIAKSLNRAITALTAGTQVLSSGYPLYTPLEPFIYRDATSLLNDELQGAARLRPQTLQPLQTLLAEVADPLREANAIAAFLQGLPRRSQQDPKPQCIVVHGRDSSAACHELARDNGFISLGTPVSPSKFDYDVVVRWSDQDNGLTTLVHKRYRKLLRQAGIPFKRTGLFGLGSYLKATGQTCARLAGAGLLRSSRAAAMLPVYAPALRTSVHLARELMPGAHLIFSEELRLPWRFPAGSTGQSHGNGSDDKI